jgi:8-amino-7-oxononanoate synthase
MKMASEYKRSLKPISKRDKGKIVVKGQEYWDFSTNDYLGLAEAEELKNEALLYLKEHTFGATASRLLSGDYEIFHRLEEAIAALYKKEAALLFNSGYQANVGILSTLLNKNDLVFADRYVHASMVDGIKLSPAKLIRYRHNNVLDLKSKLAKYRHKATRALIVTESLFSMDGDIALLEKIVALKKDYGCSLMVDEAHAVGVFGQNGGGIGNELGLETEVDLIVGTFGKALGSFGAFVSCNSELKNRLVNKARSLIYSTALPPHIIAWNLKALNFVKENRGLAEVLFSKVRQFKEFMHLNQVIVDGQSQIMPIVLGAEEKAVAMAETLQKKGFWVLPIRPPTVPKDMARIRISITNHHSEEALRKLADAIGNGF